MEVSCCRRLQLVAPPRPHGSIFLDGDAHATKPCHVCAPAASVRRRRAVIARLPLSPLMCTVLQQIDPANLRLRAHCQPSYSK